LKENAYQGLIIRRLNKEYPGAIVLKNDSSYMQGIPDVVIFYQDRWAMLEVKTSEDAPFEPNQEYYIEKLDEMSYASVVYPENEDEVFYELQHALCDRR
jgi:hypothetical protein